MEKIDKCTHWKIISCQINRRQFQLPPYEGNRCFPSLLTARSVLRMKMAEGVVSHSQGYTSHLSLTDCEAGQVWPVSALETPPLISLHFIFIRQIAPPLPQIPCPLSTDTGSLGSGGRHLVGHPPHFSPEFTFTRKTKSPFNYFCINNLTGLTSS